MNVQRKFYSPQTEAAVSSNGEMCDSNGAPLVDGTVLIIKYHRSVSQNAPRHGTEINCCSGKKKKKNQARHPALSSRQRAGREIAHLSSARVQTHTHRVFGRMLA